MGVLVHVDLSPLGVTEDDVLRGIESASHKWEMRDPEFLDWDAEGVNELIGSAIESGDYLPWALLHIRNSARLDGLQIEPFEELPNVVPNLGLDVPTARLDQELGWKFEIAP
jgi:hypothetical protein